MDTKEVLKQKDEPKVLQCFVIQTKTTVSIFTHYDDDMNGQWKQISDEDTMQPLVM